MDGVATINNSTVVASNAVVAGGSTGQINQLLTQIDQAKGNPFVSRSDLNTARANLARWTSMIQGNGAVVSAGDDVQLQTDLAAGTQALATYKTKVASLNKKMFIGAIVVLIVIVVVKMRKKPTATV